MIVKPKTQRLQDSISIRATAAWFTNRDPRFAMGFFQRLLHVD
jgi:hypothetical protein